MWNESKQTRLNQLRETEAQGILMEAERPELAALIEERCRYEEAAIEKTTRRTEQENARLKTWVQQVQAQNCELEALIREQEAYLSGVQVFIAQMEERRLRSL